VATPVFGLVDEASKLNLNSATRQMLLMLPGMTEELAASIVDWRDIDQDVTDNGAEAEVYMQRRPAYACKDGPLETLEELALVNGANREILYGEDANLNGILDANEDDGAKTAPPDNSDGKLDPGVLSYLTVFSRESNKRADGTARISVETFSDELRTLLSETLTPTRATEIETQIGVGGGITSVLGFFIRSGMTADEFAKIEDAITSTSTGDFVSGRVNVNTASEAVLACVPGIGVENAAALVAARLARTSQDTNFTWVVQTLGEPAAIQAGPYITGRSYQVSADVAAVGRHGRGYRRTRFVVDTSTGTPRIIYRRDLSPLGWALGAQVRQSLLAKKEVR
jgi:DNA uptake protein ComE-like DNA-binding protein